LTARKPCRGCGGPKPPGQGIRFCGNCEHPGTSIPEDVRREMARLYLEGLSTNEVGEALFWGESSVRRVLHLDGVPLRPKTTRPRVYPNALSRDELDRTAELYLSGMSISQVAKAIGVSHSATHARLLRAEVPLRDRRESQKLLRIHELAQGRSPLTARQAAALAIVERAAPGRVLTPQIARQLRLPSNSARPVLRRLETLGLVKGARVRHGRATLIEWKRTNVAVMDVLREAIRPRVISGRSDEQIDIAPLRDWVADLLARERRAFMFESVAAGPKGGRPENDPEPIARTVARLGVDPRVLYRIMHESRTISVGTADAILAHADGPRLADLWPEFGEVAA
jgi:DNA-binding Lrp family transcriptional regulator